MLIVAKNRRILSFSKLLDVYSESCENAGKRLDPDASAMQQRRYGEKDFCEYLDDVFFATKDATYYIWAENDIYLSAARLEPYRDGWLLAGIETIPQHRGQGYAGKLMNAIIASLRLEGSYKLYSHISRRNQASIRLHRSCGFDKIYDYAKFIDGTISAEADTYLLEICKNRAE